jgi:hypothetical protein
MQGFSTEGIYRGNWIWEGGMGKRKKNQCSSELQGAGSSTASKPGRCFLFCFVLWHFGLNSGPCASPAGTLPLELLHQP